MASGSAQAHQRDPTSQHAQHERKDQAVALLTAWHGWLLGTAQPQTKLAQQPDTRRRPSGSPDPGDLAPRTLGANAHSAPMQPSPDLTKPLACKLTRQRHGLRRRPATALEGSSSAKGALRDERETTRATRSAS